MGVLDDDLDLRKATVWHEVHGHGAVDALSALIQEADQQVASKVDGTEISLPFRPPSAHKADRQVDGDTSSAGGAELSIPSHPLVHCHSAVDTPSTLNQEAGPQVGGETPNANGAELSNPSRSPVHHRSAVDTPSALNHEADRQVDSGDTSKVDGTEISLPFRPPSAHRADRQVDGDTSKGDGTELPIPSCSPVPRRSVVDSPSTLNQEAGQQVDGDTSNTNGAELSIPSRPPVHRRRTVHTSALSQEADRQVGGKASNANAGRAESSLPSRSFLPAQRSYLLNERLTYVLSVVVVIIAIVVQYALYLEKGRGDAGFIRPGWARHRSEGWQFLHGDGS